jgi:hypothetical protein
MQPLIAAVPLGRGPLGRSRRLWAIVGASIVIHLVLLSALGLMTSRPSFYISFAEKPVIVQLIPRIQTARVHRAKPSQAPESKAAVAALPSPLRPHRVPPPVLAPASPVQAPAAAPGQNQSAGQAQGATAAPAPLPAAEGGRGVRALLRGTVGCDYDAIVHLTPDEKARCAERFAAGAKKATPFMATPAEKLAGYMEEVAANERKLHYRDGSMAQPVVSCSSPDAVTAVGERTNFGLGCLTKGAIVHSKP